jgi:hypothetical protein
MTLWVQDGSVLRRRRVLAVGDGAVAPGAIGDSVASVFAAFDLGRALVGAKDDAIWAWLLVPQGRPTRLVTRLRTGPISHRPVDALVSAVLLEVGDFPMMRKMLIGIWERAESSGVTVPGHGYAA